MIRRSLLEGSEWPNGEIVKPEPAYSEDGFEYIFYTEALYDEPDRCEIIPHSSLDSAISEFEHHLRDPYCENDLIFIEGRMTDREGASLSAPFKTFSLCLASYGILGAYGEGSQTLGITDSRADPDNDNSIRENLGLVGETVFISDEQKSQIKDILSRELAKKDSICKDVLPRLQSKTDEFKECLHYAEQVAKEYDEHHNWRS